MKPFYVYVTSYVEHQAIIYAENEEEAKIIAINSTKEMSKSNVFLPKINEIKMANTEDLKEFKNLPVINLPYIENEDE